MSTMSALSKLWVATLWLIPVTTPPFLALGQTVAKPLSIIPAILVVLFVLFFGGRRTRVLFAKEALLLYAFCVSAIVGYGIIALTYSGVVEDSLGNFLRGFSALVIGVIFYLAFRFMNLTEEELRRSEKIILSALSLSIVVALLQFVANKLLPSLLPLAAMLNSALVDVASDWTDRYHGLAYEPSWLASQITLLMLPLILSRWVTGETLGVARIGLIKIRYETLFLWVAVIGIILTGSRTAFASAIAILGVGMFSLTAAKSHKAVGLNILTKLSAILAVGAVIVTGSLSGEYVYSSLAEGLEAEDLIQLAQVTHSAPRISAWISGFNVFQDNPVVGVGLGNAFTYYSENMPDWAVSYPEVQDWLNDPDARPNPKNMLVKLLAETGFVGFALFGAFVVAHFHSRNRNPRYLILRNTTVVALLFNYFSLDSFALTTEWFILGFVLLSGRDLTRVYPNSPSVKSVHEN